MVDVVVDISESDVSKVPGDINITAHGHILGLDGISVQSFFRSKNQSSNMTTLVFLAKGCPRVLDRGSALSARALVGSVALAWLGLAYIQ